MECMTQSAAVAVSIPILNNNLCAQAFAADIPAEFPRVKRALRDIVVILHLNRPGPLQPQGRPTGLG